MFTLSDINSTRDAMDRLVRVRHHPKYEDVTQETLLETPSFLHRRYLFTYTKDVFQWIPSLLLPLNFRQVRNDSYFDFDVGEVRFFIQPSCEKYYRVEGRISFKRTSDTEVTVRVHIDQLEFRDSFGRIPQWIQRRLHDFIVQQITEDLQSMMTTKN